MKTKILASLFALTTLFLSSCMEQEITVTLEKDGSGTIVEETVFGRDVIEMLEMAALQEGGQAQKNPVADLLDENKAKAKAARFGEGVEFVSLKPVARNGGKGAIVTYKFADINKIKLNPGSALSDVGPKAREVKKDEDIKINYQDGVLTLTLPHPDAEEAEKAKDFELPDEDNPETAMAMQMFRGMKIKNHLVIAPGIAESNASYQDENRITLLDIDFGQLMDNPEGLNTLKKVNLQDRAAAQKALEGLKGAKIETKKEVKVTLK